MKFIIKRLEVKLGKAVKSTEHFLPVQRRINGSFHYHTRYKLAKRPASFTSVHRKSKP